MAKSPKIVNISSKQKEYIFNEINSNISEIEKEKGIITRRLHNYDEKKDYIYFVFCLAKGDENRKKVIDFIENKSQDWFEIFQFVDSNW